MQRKETKSTPSFNLSFLLTSKQPTITVLAFVIHVAETAALSAGSMPAIQECPGSPPISSYPQVSHRTSYCSNKGSMSHLCLCGPTFRLANVYSTGNLWVSLSCFLQSCMAFYRSCVAVIQLNKLEIEGSGHRTSRIALLVHTRKCHILLHCASLVCPIQWFMNYHPRTVAVVRRQMCALCKYVSASADLRLFRKAAIVVLLSLLEYRLHLQHFGAVDFQITAS